MIRVTYNSKSTSRLRGLWFGNSGFGTSVFWLISCVLVLTGCDAVYDCVDDDGPVFDTSVLQNPVLNQEYREVIRASIDNEPGDDRFDYDFTLTGVLPEGLVYAESHRDFIISGTPIELGTYSFDLRVRVDDGLSASESGLCRTSINRNFQFTVQAM